MEGNDDEEGAEMESVAIEAWLAERVEEGWLPHGIERLRWVIDRRGLEFVQRKYVEIRRSAELSQKSVRMLEAFDGPEDEIEALSRWWLWWAPGD
jgi:hypothetical protein